MTRTYDDSDTSIESRLRRRLDLFEVTLEALNDDLAKDPLGRRQRLHESKPGLDREATLGELWREIKDLCYPVQYLSWAPIHKDSRWGAAAYRFMHRSRGL